MAEQHPAGDDEDQKTEAAGVEQMLDGYVLFITKRCEHETEQAETERPEQTGGQ